MCPIILNPKIYGSGVAAGTLNAPGGPADLIRPITRLQIPDYRPMNFSAPITRLQFPDYTAITSKWPVKHTLEKLNNILFFVQIKYS